jgi:hypothetical protein
MGQCQPVLLAGYLAAPRRVATDGTQVYWTNSGDGTAMSCPVSGCGTPNLLGTASNFVGPIKVAGNSVYWAGGSGIVTCAGAGCNQNPTPIATNQSLPVDLAVDSANLYWANEAMPGVVPGAVMQCALGGCNGAPLQLGSGSGPVAVASDGRNVYWCSTDTPKMIWRCAVGGCGQSPTAFASRPYSQNSCFATSMAVDPTGANLYWLEQDLMQVRTCPTSAPACAAPAVLVSSGGQSMQQLAVDAANVYWTDKPSGQILFCAVAGCSDTPTLLTNAFGVEGIALDSTSVYFTVSTSSGGKVYRIAKPGHP